jgi:nucleotide-binding universal stress UspA family protein
VARPGAVRPKSIVVAVDGSPPSREAGRFAVGLASDTGARLHIIHVVDLSAATTAALLEGAANWTQMLPAMRESARMILGLTVREAEEEGVPHTVKVLEGTDLAASIVREAEEEGASMIVLGSHGRTGLRRVLLGSVAERVVRLAHCPVLVHRRAAPQR